MQNEKVLPQLSKFQKKVYAKLCEVPAGKVTTYQDLAQAVGSKACRAVGSAMSKNPFAPEVPCHRVVKANGEIGQYALGAETKIAMLLAEGIEVLDKKVDLAKFRYDFQRTFVEAT
jgi:methylated-DNA-[protein]-cysteine S-methyltransferase